MRPGDHDRGPLPFRDADSARSSTSVHRVAKTSEPAAPPFRQAVVARTTIHAPSSAMRITSEELHRSALRSLHARARLSAESRGNGAPESPRLPSAGTALSAPSSSEKTARVATRTPRIQRITLATVQPSSCDSFTTAELHSFDSRNDLERRSALSRSAIAHPLAWRSIAHRFLRDLRRPIALPNVMQVTTCSAHSVLDRSR